jgi:hypothetical protein
MRRFSSIMRPAGNGMDARLFFRALLTFPSVFFFVFSENTDVPSIEKKYTAFNV